MANSDGLGRGGSERLTYIAGEEMSVSRWLESFANEISQMSETDEDHVAGIGRE